MAIFRVSFPSRHHWAAAGKTSHFSSREHSNKDLSGLRDRPTWPAGKIQGRLQKYFG